MLLILRSNPNKFWRLLSNKSRPSQIELADPGGDTLDPEKCASALNDYFVSVFTPANITPVNHTPIIRSHPMTEIEINAQGISNLISSLPLSVSGGCDEINSKLLKNTASLSSRILCLIFSQSLDSGNIPDDWKKARIIPVFKSGDRSSPFNYRPISLTSIPSKLFEHIIASNLMAHLESINFFYPQQHGFRKLYSCETQLAEFTHDILQYMDDHYQIDSIFLDFSKAFDRVPHNHLLLKLSGLGLTQKLLSWLEHYLKGRVQCTCANNYTSPLSSVTSGVPQGAVLSPLLFLIYINDLPSNIKSKLRLFADDCIVYRAITNQDDTCTLQQDLNAISLWCETWLMPLNTTKCKVMTFSRLRNQIKTPYYLNSTPVAYTSSYKYLGLHMTPSLSWVTHIETICSEASRVLGYMRRSLSDSSSDIKKLAYLTFVRPKLEYASAIWNPSQSYLAANLEAIQNRAARFITSNYSRNSSVTSMKRDLDLPSLASRRIISRLCLLHTFYYHPRSRHELLTTPLRRSSRLSHSQSLARISTRTLAMSTSFFPHAIVLWNSLPDNIAECTDRKQFRNKLKLQPS